MPLEGAAVVHIPQEGIQDGEGCRGAWAQLQVSAEPVSGQYSLYYTLIFPQPEHLSGSCSQQRGLDRTLQTFQPCSPHTH